MRNTRRFVHRGLAIAIPAVFLFTAAAQEPGPSVDDVIKKHVDARGGRDKLKAVQSVKANGKMVMMGGQIEAPFTMQLKRPSSLRMEMEIQGKSLVQAYDGSSAWMINPFQGGTDAQKMGEDEKAELETNADFDGSLIDYKTKGHTVELIGKEDLEGSPAYKLKVVKKSGKNEYHYIDAQSFLEIKMSTKAKMMGNEMDMDTYPSNYKSLNGVMVPFTVETKSGDKPFMTMTFEKFEANVPMDDAIFKMPAKEEKKEEKKDAAK